MQITEATSQKIKNMSLLCAAFVVMIHSLPFPPQAIKIPGQILHGVWAIAVPFFFVISGFFLASHFGEKGWWGRAIKKRISSLAIPFFLWELIFITSIIIPCLLTYMTTHHLPYAYDFCWKSRNWLELLGFDLTIEPLHHALWYVRCLFVFILAAPLFNFFSKFKIIWPTICFIIDLLDNHMPIHSPFPLFSFFYFSVGIFLYQNKSFRINNKIALLSATIGFSLLIIKSIFLNPKWAFMHDLEKISIPFLMIMFWHYTPSQKLPLWPTSCSFPIYVLHWVFIPYISFAVRHLSFANVLEPIVRFVVGFFGSILVATLLRKYLPKTAKVLFGGR